MISNEVKRVYIMPQEESGFDASATWFSLFNPIDLAGDDTNEVTMAPLESGMKHFDGKVENPSKIEVVGYVTCDKIEEFTKRIMDGLREMDFKKCLWVVGSKADYWDYCVLVGVKENDEKDMYDNVKYTLSFVQALVDPDDFANNNGGDSDTQNSGMAGSWTFPSLPDNLADAVINNMIDEVIGG